MHKNKLSKSAVARANELYIEKGLCCLCEMLTLITKHYYLNPIAVR